MDASLKKLSKVCGHCNGTKLIAIWSRDGTYAAPGPVPEDARGYTEAVCWYCGLVTDDPVVQCETCNGRGKTGPVHINRGNQPHEWRESMPCSVCGGSGQIYAEHAKRIAHGKRLRAKRIARGESLREAAARRGMSPSHLSAIEHGRI